MSSAKPIAQRADLTPVVQARKEAPTTYSPAVAPGMQTRARLGVPEIIDLSVQAVGATAGTVGGLTVAALGGLTAWSQVSAPSQASGGPLLLAASLLATGCGAMMAVDYFSAGVKRAYSKLSEAQREIATPTLIIAGSIAGFLAWRSPLTAIVLVGAAACLEVVRRACTDEPPRYVRPIPVQPLDAKTRAALNNLGEVPHPFD